MTLDKKAIWFGTLGFLYSFYSVLSCSASSSVSIDILYVGL